ncbi:MAG: NAD-dependent epimerase/dehydratase family protein [Pseudomonadota bacterium]
MRILVTGGAGFIGSRLCHRLLGDGHDVVTLDNFDPFYDPAIKEHNIRALEARAAGRFSLVRGDIRDMAALDAAWDLGPYDRVVHLAAKAGVRPSLSNPGDYLAVNVMGLVNVLTCCRDRGPTKLVVASSSSVYGNTSGALHEDMPADRPVSPYAASKRAGELLCHTWHHLYGLDITCLRFFTVFGPGQRPEMAIHLFTRLLSEGDPIQMYGDGTTSRDYTYIDDIVDGVVRALEQVSGYRIYNLGGGRPVPLRDLIGLIGAALGVTPLIQQMPMQAGDVEHTQASVERAREDLGFQVTTSIEDGIPAFVEWYRQMRSDLEE